MLKTQDRKLFQKIIILWLIAYAWFHIETKLSFYKEPNLQETKLSLAMIKAISDSNKTLKITILDSSKAFWGGHSNKKSSFRPVSENSSTQSIKKKRRRSKTKNVVKKNIMLVSININTANQKHLQQLKGVGPALAKRIIEYREAKGPFKKAKDLLNVKGIGQKKLNLILEHITFS